MKTTKLNFITIIVLTLSLAFYIGRISKRNTEIIKVINNNLNIDSIVNNNLRTISLYNDTINLLTVQVDSLKKLISVNNRERDEEIIKLPSYSIRQLDSVAFSNTSRYYMLRHRGYEDSCSE